MRIADTSTGQGVLVEREEGDSQELVVIAQRIMPEWLALFARKNRDYGSGSAYELGVRGQYSDIHRKMIKLKRAMWDGEQLDFEDTDEIIKDLISHLFLTLHMFGLQVEAEQAYVYNEDDAAVDSFFRMVGGDAETALKMSGVLQHPFRDMVRERAHKMLQAEQAEHAESISLEVTSSRVHQVMDEMQQELMAQRLKRGEDERLYNRIHHGRDEPLRMPVSEAVRRHVSAPRDGYGDAPETADARLRETAYERLAGEEFAQFDAEQHGVVVGYNFDAAEQNHHPYGAELKVGPQRIITEMVDGRVQYYHEAYPGADREPLALVPKALIERAQKDQHVMAREQEAGLNTLAAWLDRS